MQNPAQNENSSKVELFFRFLKEYGSVITNLATIGLIIYSISIFQNQNDTKNKAALAVVAERDKAINELKDYKRIQADSSEILHRQLANIVKLIAATELTIKQKPDETKVLNKYNTLSDSSAYSIFMQRYGKEYLNK